MGRKTKRRKERPKAVKLLVLLVANCLHSMLTWEETTMKQRTSSSRKRKSIQKRKFTKSGRIHLALVLPRHCFGLKELFRRPPITDTTGVATPQASRLLFRLEQKPSRQRKRRQKNPQSPRLLLSRSMRTCSAKISATSTRNLATSDWKKEQAKTESFLIYLFQTVLIKLNYKLQFFRYLGKIKLCFNKSCFL